MDNAVATNTGTPLRWDPSQSLALGPGRVVFANAPRLVVELEGPLARRVLTADEQRISSELGRIPVVDAVYCDRDHEGLLMVFAVVEEHTDQAYEAILTAEDTLVACCDGPIGLRVRAHQRRDTRKAVPVGSLPLFVR